MALPRTSVRSLLSFFSLLSLFSLACGGPSNDPKTQSSADASLARGFDRGSAANAIGSVDAQACKQAGDPTGVGHLKITFQPDGSVSAVVLDGVTRESQNPFIGTATGDCLVARFKAIRIKPFADGDPINVGKSFTIRWRLDGHMAC